MMKAETKKIYEKAFELHTEMIAMLATLDKPTADVDETADATYVLKRTAELLKETRAAVNRRHDLFDTILVAIVVDTQELTVRTEWCTVTVSVKVATQVPTAKKMPFLYSLFLKEVLDITNEDVIASGVVSIHYQGWSDYYTQMLTQGKDLPPALRGELKQYDASKTTIRKKKDLLEPIE